MKHFQIDRVLRIIVHMCERINFTLGDFLGQIGTGLNANKMRPITVHCT